MEPVSGAGPSELTASLLAHQRQGSAAASIPEHSEQHEDLPQAKAIIGSPWAYGRTGAFFKTPAGSMVESVTEAEEQDEEQGGAEIARRSSIERKIVRRSSTFVRPLVTDPGLGSKAGEEAKQVSKAFEKPTKVAQSLYKSIIYGLINGIVGIPTMISFASIIYRDPIYAPYLGKMAKLGFFASGVHQAVFALRSTLPFAVGQVQDVGLIFLSSMATSIAAIGTDSGLSVAEVLGTTMVWLSISTVIVGLLTTLIGRFKLASMVQFVPLPVVGGYLAFVGFFCIAAGAGLACGVDIQVLSDWAKLFRVALLGKILATAVATAAIFMTLKYVSSPLGLPAVLIAVPVAFHVVRLVLGCSMEDATQAGWLMRSEGGGEAFWSIYELFNLHWQDGRLAGVQWSAMPQQIPQLIALFLVVAFGSSLDVAAIQQDMPNPLDYNSELVTVGISNVVAGAVGAGMTGSYIFSQTIFSMRAGIDNRLMGAIVSAMELLLFIVPFSVVEYMPNFFYGSLLVMFGIEISLDWLIHSYHKVTQMEYLLLWVTFVAILQGGLEVGIGVGIVAATLYFAYAYSRMHLRQFTVVPTRSGTVRPWDQRIVLDLLCNRVVAVQLSGYIFFGSALAVNDKVMEVVKAMTSEQAAAAGDDADHPTVAVASGFWVAPERTASVSRSLKHRAVAILPDCPTIVILDFKRVHALDSTAARTLATLWNTLAQLEVELILTSLHQPAMRHLLQAHGLVLSLEEDEVEGGCRVFASLAVGMEYCETRYLAVAQRRGLCEAQPATMSLAQILQSHLEEPKAMFAERTDYERVARELGKHTQHRHLAPGEALFASGDEADEIYIIEAGSISQYGTFLNLSEEERHIGLPQDLLAEAPTRTFDYGPGSIVGEEDFFLQRHRNFSARCGAQPCRLTVIPRAAFGTLKKRAPEALILLQSMLLRSVCFTESHALETLERSTADRGGAAG